jgi:type IV pilus assembly protein PilB
MDLAELLVERAFLDAAVLDELRHRSRAQDRPLVVLIVQSGIIEEELLAEHAARGLDTILLELDRGEMDEETLQLLPAAIARRYLALPVAPDPDGKSLRVAFADPYDEAAVDAVRTHTGLQVQPLVATVSDLRTAIDRAYGVAAEVTQQLDRLVGPATAPMHRLEDSATPEQRHQALLLALIDAGVLTREDYVQALLRLLGRS